MEKFAQLHGPLELEPCLLVINRNWELIGKKFMPKNDCVKSY